MKLKSILLAVLTAICLTATVSADNATTPTTPVYPVPGAAPEEVYNDQHPMPELFPWLASPEAMKAYALRQVTQATLSIRGDIISLNDTLNVSAQGGTPNEMLGNLAAMNYQFSMPDKTKSVQVSTSLINATNWTLFMCNADVVPTLQPDGKTYALVQKLELELQPWQPVYLGPGIQSVIITNDLNGYTNTQTLWVGQDGWTQIPVWMLANKGFLMIVRTEPSGIGTTRNVSYGYEIGSGKSTLMTPVKNNQVFRVKNYFEFTDLGRPLFLAGNIVPLMVDMRLSKKATSDGRFEYESQPVSRIEVTVPNRTVVIQTGLTDSNTGMLWEQGKSVKVRNAATGEVKDVPMEAGMGAVVLPRGSYDVIYHLDSLGTNSYWGVG